MVRMVRAFDGSLWSLWIDRRISTAGVLSYACTLYARTLYSRVIRRRQSAVPPPAFPLAPRNTTTCIRCRSIYMCFTGLGAADDDDGDTCVREGGRCGTPSFCNRPYDAGSKHVGRHVGLAVHTWIESTVTTYTPTHTKATNTISKKTKRLGMPGTTPLCVLFTTCSPQICDRSPIGPTYEC